MSNEPDIPSYDLQQSVTDTPLRSQQQQQRQRQQEQGEQQEQQQEPLDGESGRRRSSSDPVGRGRQRPGLAILRPRRGTNGSTLSQIPENARPMSTALFNSPKRRTEIDENLADILDVIDPEVSMLNNVTNIQNSLFVPSLGRFINRRPTYQLSVAPEQPRIREEKGEGEGEGEGEEEQFNFDHAVIPDGVFLEGWTDEEKAELNDYVRHMLHSRRSKFKRNMRAFGQYVKKPLGFFVTLYATLITLFGLAWVLFLIGWIYVGEEQLYIINVIDNVLVALFAVVGDGLAPFRAVDTYHMAYIARYHRLTWKLREKKRMGNLRDKNDLPTNEDLEAARDELSVLTPQQQARLVHHQTKFAKSHTFYKPHETKTHFAFPLNLLVTIVTLLDMHSCLQIALGATTWGIDWHTRPMAITATILCCSIAVNITAGILISVGSRRTRKKDVVERMFRQDLTREAFDKLRSRGEKQGNTEKELKAKKALEQAPQNEANDDTKSEEIRGVPIESGKEQRYPDNTGT
ncbi:uncharacterized protein GGS25DRAFT_468981 [Hypoxylon fragiforme]|uniref:uncharacterized protein n=1 Tax=Hypoxylon fragiforme TaxID=63214 RepID=UPI0020C5DF29|nr:uncharacterized protein GGS25DRAFT_468981 [Hypoxylon fragiforme]KAI2613806.1 hypothetical protein GGS25DRAFT_468981 [Hypoxylon fragiforme]